MRIEVKTFCLPCTTEQQALKVLEEAAEVFAAWQEVNNELSMGMPFDKGLEEELGCEIADCVTACCNLAEKLGINLQAMIKKVEKKNRERGRYGREQQ